MIDWKLEGYYLTKWIKTFYYFILKNPAIVYTFVAFVGSLALMKILGTTFFQRISIIPIVYIALHFQFKYFNYMGEVYNKVFDIEKSGIDNEN